MTIESVSIDPACTVCGEAVLPGEPVVFRLGQDVHVRCHLASAATADAIAAYLEAHAGEFCQVCLAAALGIPEADVRHAVAAPRVPTRFRISAIGRCTACGHARPTAEVVSPQ
jgi:hypothetical protein